MGVIHIENGYVPKLAFALNSNGGKDSAQYHNVFILHDRQRPEPMSEADFYTDAFISIMKGIEAEFSAVSINVTKELLCAVQRLKDIALPVFMRIAFDDPYAGNSENIPDVTYSFSSLPHYNNSADFVWTVSLDAPKDKETEYSRFGVFSAAEYLEERLWTLGDYFTLRKGRAFLFGDGTGLDVNGIYV